MSRKKTKCPACKTALAADYDEPTCPNEECGINFEEFEAERDEQARVGRLHQLARHFELGDVWAQKHISAGSSVEAAQADGKRELARRAPRIDGSVSIEHEYDAPGSRMEAMAAALAARARRVEPEGPARRYYGQRIVDLAFELGRPTGHMRGLDPRWNGGRIIDVALAHVTSDFPGLLGNTVNRILLPAYENAQPTYRQIAQRRDFRDFREHTFARAGDFPTPLVVGESGEITEGSIGENAETGVALTYARIFNISRQALVNDDLGAFSDLGSKAATRAIDLEDALFYQKCIAPAAGLGPDLADGVAVYNAAHSNVGGAGALDSDVLDACRALMMAQESIDGLKINVLPRFLLTSPTSYGLGERLCAPLSVLIGQGENAGAIPNANPYAGKLTPIADANLTGTRFYLLGDPSAGQSNYIYGNVRDETSPYIEARAGFEVDGLQVKLRLDIGFAVTDYRFGVTAAGA